MLYRNYLWGAGLYFLLVVPLSSTTYYGYGGKTNEPAASQRGNYNTPRKSLTGSSKFKSPAFNDRYRQQGYPNVAPSQSGKVHGGPSSVGHSTVSKGYSGKTQQGQYFKTGTVRRPFNTPKVEQKSQPASGRPYSETVPHRNAPSSWGAKGYGTSLKAPGPSTGSVVNWATKKPKQTFGSLGHYSSAGSHSAFGKPEETKKVSFGSRDFSGSRMSSSGSSGSSHTQWPKPTLSTKQNQRGSGTWPSQASSQSYGYGGIRGNINTGNRGQNPASSRGGLLQDADTKLLTVPTEHGRGIIERLSEEGVKRGYYRGSR